MDPDGMDSREIMESRLVELGKRNLERKETDNMSAILVKCLKEGSDCSC
jgi:serine/threonine protein phosphatase PrpC